MTLRTALVLGLLGVPLALAVPIAAQGQSNEELAKQLAQQLVNNANPASFHVSGLGRPLKSVKDDTVQGGRAIKVPVTGKGNPWDITVIVPITKPIRAGDKIQMMFHAKLDRAEAGVTTAKTGAGIQLAAAPYSSFMTQSFDITPEWKLFQLSGTADKDYPVGSINATFQVNTGKHVIALGIVAVFDKGQ